MHTNIFEPRVWFHPRLMIRFKKLMWGNTTLGILLKWNNNEHLICNYHIY